MKTLSFPLSPCQPAETFRVYSSKSCILSFAGRNRFWKSLLISAGLGRVDLLNTSNILKCQAFNTSSDVGSPESLTSLKSRFLTKAWSQCGQSLGDDFLVFASFPYIPILKQRDLIFGQSLSATGPSHRPSSTQNRPVVRSLKPLV